MAATQTLRRWAGPQAKRFTGEPRRAPREGKPASTHVLHMSPEAPQWHLLQILAPAGSLHQRKLNPSLCGPQALDTSSPGEP